MKKLGGGRSAEPVRHFLQSLTQEFQPQDPHKGGKWLLETVLWPLHRYSVGTHTHIHTRTRTCNLGICVRGCARDDWALQLHQHSLSSAHVLASFSLGTCLKEMNSSGCHTVDLSTKVCLAHQKHLFPWCEEKIVKCAPRSYFSRTKWTIQIRYILTEKRHLLGAQWCTDHTDKICELRDKIKSLSKQQRKHSEDWAAGSTVSNLYSMQYMK